MRVLHIASGDLWAGAEVMLCDLAIAQSRMAGIKVAVFLLNDGRLARALRDAGVEVVLAPESSLNLLQLVQRCRATIRRQRAEIIHSHRIKEDIIGALAAATSRPRALCVRTVHGVDEAQRTTLKARLSAAMHRLITRGGFARTFAVSRPLALQLAAAGGAGVTHIANGIALEKFAEHGATHRARKGFVMIGIVGRLVPVKRVDIFLRTAQLLSAQHPGRYRFVIHGEGPEEDSLRALAAGAGLDAVVSFAGFSADILAQMSQLDLLLLCSDSEGLPMVILEAMALGVGVVAAAVGEIPEVLDGGRCGTLVHQQEAEHYARAIERVHAAPAHLQQMILAARERVQQHYSVESSARGYAAGYRDVLESARPESRAA